MTTTQLEFETIGITGREFQRIFHQALLAVDPKTNRYYLNRVRLEIENKILLAIGTDGRVLTRASARLVKFEEGEELSDRAEKVFGFSVLLDTAKDMLVKFASVKEDTQLVLLSTNGTTLKVSHGELEYVITELTDDFPDWRRLFPEYYGANLSDKEKKDRGEYTTSLKINFDYLFDAVKGLKSPSREDWFSLVPGENFVEVRIATKSQGDTVAMQRNRIKCEYLKRREGDFVCFYNADFLQVLKSSGKAGYNVSSITISMRDNVLGAVKIYENSPVDSIPTVHLIMPIRNHENSQDLEAEAPPVPLQVAFVDTSVS